MVNTRREGITIAIQSGPEFCKNFNRNLKLNDARCRSLEALLQDQRKEPTLTTDWAHALPQPVVDGSRRPA